MKRLTLTANQMRKIMQITNSVLYPALDSWMLSKYNKNGVFDITDEFLFMLKKRLQQKERDYSENIKRLEDWLLDNL